MSEKWETVTLTPSDLNDLKKLYRNAVESGVESFMFKGKELVTGFAKYWIEFIETQFEVRTQCPICGKAYVPILQIPAHDTRMIQEIFPDAEPWQREQLLTGICSEACWEKEMGPEEE